MVFSFYKIESSKFYLYTHWSSNTILELCKSLGFNSYYPGRTTLSTVHCVFIILGYKNELCMTRYIHSVVIKQHSSKFVCHNSSPSKNFLSVVIQKTKTWIYHVNLLFLTALHNPVHCWQSWNCWKCVRFLLARFCSIKLFLWLFQLIRLGSKVFLQRWSRRAVSSLQLFCF